MQINRVVIKNYRALQDVTIEFRAGVNILVGDNEAGKSTVLEAIHAALTGQIGGRSIRYQLHPFMFNRAASDEFAKAVAAGKKPPPPEILIEIYFDDDDALVRLKGTNNSRKEDAPGVRLQIRVEETSAADFAEYISGSKDVEMIPVEFFAVDWQSFAYAPLNSRAMPFKSRLIDTTAGVPGRGAWRYLFQLIGDSLTTKEKIELSLAYRSMKRAFEQAPAIQKINGALATRKGELSEKALAIAMDVSATEEWSEGVVPLLDRIPFDLVGRGEQSAASIWLAVDAASQAHLVMIEEPENHLSYGRLNAVISRAAEQTKDRQMIVTTHSSFVMNKLGLSNVLLFHTSGSVRLTDLPPETTSFFRRLPGHDTLRMVLAKKVILAEGPSDELIVQRAYRDKHGKRPIEDGVDVLSVRALSFKRYLDIARKLGKPVSVVTDNDGDTIATRARYKDYDGIAHIRICVPEQAGGHTLEPQLVGCNTIETLQAVLKRQFADTDQAVKWMRNNKTEAAILIHDADRAINYPKYVTDAVA
ncbi:AAA family ATPase [Sorangium sp. So ce375]|uniref:ATP-dependent nuclease n=1 Tax=Sorangium sp. So ce375 TaxID=3133306 RepID=UPI003F5B15D8